MNKQDKLWNELSEEQRAEYSKEFQQETKKYSEDVKHCDSENDFEYNTGYSYGVITTLEAIFGSHNLNPKPKIRTWEDVCKRVEWDIDSWLSKIENAWIGYPIARKMIATAKIAKLIELGYGGMVSDEEWKNIGLPKYTIIPCNVKDELRIDMVYARDDKQFTAFHSQELAEEFMSYPENVELVKQYHML